MYLFVETLIQVIPILEVEFLDLCLIYSTSTKSEICMSNVEPGKLTAESSDFLAKIKH